MGRHVDAKNLVRKNPACPGFFMSVQEGCAEACRILPGS